GGMTAGSLVQQLVGAGVARVEVVYDPGEGRPPLPKGIEAHPRRDLDRVQRSLAEVEGTTALVYVQTCATEKKRRRKRGLMVEAPARVLINPDVCEGCGDCGVQSNCVAVQPLDTALGLKRRIEQSACTQDLSCLKGFCPSFVTVEGATPRRAEASMPPLPDLSEPALPPLDRAYGLLVTGIGGTGVVTVGALISMAAHLEGRGAAEMQMAGLAQKGGAVSIHCRVAPRPADIHAVRLATGEADAVIAADLVVAADPKSLALMAPGRTGAVAAGATAALGGFALDPGARADEPRLVAALEARLGGAVPLIDARGLAQRCLGDTIYANVLLLGAAWQRGLVPVAREALEAAIRLNGAGVEGNLAAFALGRWAGADPEGLAAALGSASVPEPQTQTLDAVVDDRAARLVAYQDRRLAERYRAAVARARAAEDAAGVEGFARAVAEGYFKLLAIKDEYEVARLHHETTAALVAGAFEGGGRVRYHLAPPLISREGPDGRPMKRAFGPWIGRAFALLRHGKALRGTAFDLFGRTAERRMERALIADYEAALPRWCDSLAPATAGTLAALAALPLEIRGFGPVKAAAAERAAARRAALEAVLADGGAPAPLATAAE
ncbi:MAG: DUF6537 domain-containing protein, partial [Pseudomonadota bacterium]